MLFYAVDRHERKQDRCLLYISLIFRILSVDFVLTDFKSACSAEHYVYDSDISDSSDYPLP